MFKEYIKPLLVLTVIALFFATALALAHGVTDPVIAEAAEERANEAMRNIIPDATGFIPIELDFAQDLNKTVREAYRTENDVGYIFIAEATGYSGKITVICAIDNDGRIINAQTLSHTETVGIGTIIEQEEFLGQFEGAGSGLEGVDTVTGATISTRAFMVAIDGIFSVYEIIKDNTYD